MPLLTPGGKNAFTELTDTPESYSGSTLKLLRVDALGQAIEFVNPNELGLAASSHNHSAAEITTGTMAVARLPILVGDSGSGGTAGLVPAPAAGESSNFLRGDGVWAEIETGGSSEVEFSAYTDTLFVGKHGNDSNDGTDPNSPKLTIGSALTAASALSPASDNIVLIQVIDTGTYDESVTVPAYVNLYAPAAKINPASSSGIITSGNNNIWIGEVEVSGSNVAIDVRGAGEVNVTFQNLILNGAATGIRTYAAYDGHASVNGRYIEVTDGKAVDHDAAALDTYFSFNVDTILAVGSGAYGVYSDSNSPNIAIGFVGKMYKGGTGTDFTAVYVAGDSALRYMLLTAPYIDADVKFEGNGEYSRLYLLTFKATGTEVDTNNQIIDVDIFALNAHLNDVSKHREIDDGTSTATVLWSGEYINSQLNLIPEIADGESTGSDKLWSIDKIQSELAGIGGGIDAQEAALYAATLYL